MFTDYILDDYIDSVETYAENLNKELYNGETSRNCAEHMMSWCDLNNRDLASIPMQEYKSIFDMYYHDKRESFNDDFYIEEF